MLIRVYNHRAKYNKEMIDEIININGLPEDMFFSEASGTYIYDEPDDDGKQKEEFRRVTVIKSPWEADVEENIPSEILKKYGMKKEYYIKIDKQVVGPYTARAIRVDCDTAQGIEAWKRIEAILERDTPRDRSVPVPAKVGNRSEWTLDADDVPSIDLSKKEVSVDSNGNKPKTLIEELNLKSEKRRPGRPRKEKLEV